MPSPNGLSEHQEAVLFAIWKLRAIGGRAVTEDQVLQITEQSDQDIPTILRDLQSRGFVEIRNKAGRSNISMTPLGVAILRKVEEDRLEEIK
jgi:predicted transcriptional regulator